MKKFAVWMILSVFLIGLVPSVGAAQSTPTPYRNYWTATPRWSPDGSKIAIPLDDYVEVHDTTTTALLFTLTGHTAAVTSVAWSPDNSEIATASADQTIKIWSAAEGKLLHTLIGQNDFVGTVSWSRDGTRLASTGIENQPNLVIWDARTGKIVSTAIAGSGVDAAFSPDGKHLLVSYDLSLALLDAHTFDLITRSPNVLCCANQMYTLAWSPDGNAIVTGSMNGLITLWDGNTLQMRNQFAANSYYVPDSRDVANLGLSWVRAVTFSADGKTILTASGDGTIGKWDAATGDLLHATRIDPIMAAAWSPDDKRLAVLALHVPEGVSPSDTIYKSSELAGDLRIITPFSEQLICTRSKTCLTK